MIDTPDRFDDRHPPFNCIRCGQPIPDGNWYVYCSTECRDADVPTEPGRGGVRS